MNKQPKSKLTGYNLIEGDAAEILATFPANSYDLVITSPPYNMGKEYELNEHKSLDLYLEKLDRIVELLIAKLSPSGSICWQVGNFVENGEIIPLDVLTYPMFQRRGLKLRNRIIWRFNFGLHATNRFSGRYETVLWFTKSDNYTFNLDTVRIPQLYPGKRYSSKKGAKAGLPSGNPLGKNPADFWEFNAKDHFAEGSVWDIPNVKSNHPEKTFHPCQFPIELAERCVLALSSPGDTVFDPFVGTGTTVLAALRHARSGIGLDRERKYLVLARTRISELGKGTLKIRQLGKPVPNPKLMGRVAETPKEWLKQGGDEKKWPIRANPKRKKPRTKSLLQSKKRKQSSVLKRGK